MHDKQLIFKKLQSIDGHLYEQAKTIATFIDAIAGDFPLISGMPSFMSNGVLWQYDKHDFVIRIGNEHRKFPTQEQIGEGAPSDIFLIDLEDALEFIRITESIRQKTSFPLIKFGKINSACLIEYQQETVLSSH